LANPRLPDDIQHKIIQLRREGLSYRAIGEQLGINSSTAHKHCKSILPEAGIDRATGQIPREELNKPIDDRGPVGGETHILTPDRPRTLEEMYVLFGIDKTKWIPTALRANEWQGFYKLPTGSHQKVALWQTRVSWKRVVTEYIESAILEFMRENLVAKPAPPRRVRTTELRRPGFMVSWGLWDTHLGMHAWRGEVGEDYDLKIAARRVFNSIDDMAEELRPYPVSKILMPIGNDFMHFDNAKAQTTFGEHYLDTDSRYGKVYLEALRCLAYMIETALQLTNHLELIYVPGNHDLATSFTLVAALAQRYRNDARVVADLDFNPRKYRVHGRTLIGFEHGQKCKAQQLALIMAEECREVWSQVKYREIQIGHTHQHREHMYQSVTPNNGVLIRTNPSLCNADAWHHAQGFIGGTRCVEAWRYDMDGFRGSHATCARDDISSSNESFHL
jgi:hypothetical protein